MGSVSHARRMVAHPSFVWYDNNEGLFRQILAWHISLSLQVSIMSILDPSIRHSVISMDWMDQMKLRLPSQPHLLKHFSVSATFLLLLRLPWLLRLPTHFLVSATFLLLLWLPWQPRLPKHFSVSARFLLLLGLFHLRSWWGGGGIENFADPRTYF